MSANAKTDLEIAFADIEITFADSEIAFAGIENVFADLANALAVQNCGCRGVKIFLKQPLILIHPETLRIKENKARKKINISVNLSDK